MTDPLQSANWVKDQYGNSSNLRARARIYQLFGRSETDTREWMDWVFDQFDLPGSSRILELGCGTAALWAKNSHRVPLGWDIVLTDLSPGMVEEARRAQRFGNQPFTALVCDARSLPFDDESFDAVIANHTLYHIQDRQTAFAEIHRVLRRSGRLYATTVGESHLAELAQLLTRVKPELSKEWAEPSVQFGLESGADQLKACFTEVEVRRNDGELTVTEVGPLVDYVQSTTRLRLDETQEAEFRRLASDHISAHDAIRITTSSGMLIASKGAVQES